MKTIQELQAEAHAIATVVEIIALLARGRRDAFVASIFGVSESSIGYIRRCKTWDGVTLQEPL